MFTSDFVWFALIACLFGMVILLAFMLGVARGKDSELDKDDIQWPIDHPLHRRKNRDNRQC